MTVENISRSISMKECCRPRRGLNSRPPGLQSDGASNWATEAGKSIYCTVIAPTGILSGRQRSDVDLGEIKTKGQYFSMKKKNCQILHQLPIYAFCLGPETWAKDMGKWYWPRSEAAERGVWLGSTMFALNTGISIKHDIDKNKTCRKTCTRKGHVNRVEVAKSTRHEWVKTSFLVPQATAL